MDTRSPTHSRVDCRRLIPPGRSPVAGAQVPIVSAGGEVLDAGAGDDPPTGFVGVERSRVAVSQLERRGSLLLVGKAMDTFQLDGPPAGTEFVQHPASSRCGVLREAE